MPENLPDANSPVLRLLHGVFMLTSGLLEISIFGIFSSFFLHFVVQFGQKNVFYSYFDIFERFQMVSHEKKRSHAKQFSTVTVGV